MSRFNSAHPRLPLLLLLAAVFLPLLVIVSLKSVVNKSPSGLSVPEFFTSLGTGDLRYDLNRDGQVTGEDYTPLVNRLEVSRSSPSDVRVLQAATETLAEGDTGKQIVPSINGFGSDEFNGAVTASVPVSLPPGPAGLTPSLNIGYSSASVDNLQLGTSTLWRNDINVPYQNQAGFVGLGWDLGGISYIAKSASGYTLVFPGGSAKLSNETDDGFYSVWRTVPNLKIKAERWARCKIIAEEGTNRELSVCRYHWLVTGADGTKYYFGYPTTVTNWKTQYDPEGDNLPEGTGNDWYPLYTQTASGADSPIAWKLVKESNTYVSNTYKWHLSKVESPFNVNSGTPAVINYSYRIELGAFHSNYYVSSAYPLKITYGKNEVNFIREPRFDYYTAIGGDTTLQKQYFRSKDRLLRISIKTSGKSVGAYEFSYKYGWNPAQHNDANNNGIPDSQSEVVNYKTIHSLLSEIRVYDSDRAGNASAKRLPSSKFSYTQLTSFTDRGGSNVQEITPNDFFLKSVENGYSARVTYEYWQDANAKNALNTRYCDPDIMEAGEGCRTDHAKNAQQHRIAAKIIEDGMGNFFLTSYAYTGDGASQGLASVENYATLAEFQFLGYPEVTTSVYAQNSKTVLASKTKKIYFQKIETPNCFKPNPLKGLPSRTIVFDAKNTTSYIQTVQDYKVRFGDMFGTPVVEKTSGDLASYCVSYLPSGTVTLVMPVESRTQSLMPGPQLCTRSTTNYNHLDGTSDPYALPHTVVDWGKVNCLDANVDDTSDSPLYSITDYTAANTAKGILPLPKETWISNSSSGTKYRHTQTYYDGKTLGALGDFGRITKITSLVNGAAYAGTSTTYDSTYPWLAVKSTDPLGRITSTEYDTVFRIYPVKTTNHLGQVSQIAYDFNITDTSHPNYSGVRGLPVKVTDPNGSAATSVYDSFGRLVESYLPGKKPGTGIKPDAFSKYYYFNETEISPCTEANNCFTGLGRQVNNTGPKLLVFRGNRFADAGTVGKVSGTYIFTNGLGQTVQTRSSWYENEWSAAGIPVGTDLNDILTSQSYTSLGQVEYQSLSYTAAPYLPPGTNIYDTRNFLTTADIKKIKNTFDGFGRLTAVNYPDGSSARTEYDVGGNPLKTKSLSPNCTDGNSATPCAESISTADAFGRILKTEEVAPSKTYTTTHEYQPVLGTETKTRDTLGNPVNITEYDTLGRKIKLWNVDMSPQMSGDANSWRYEYDKSDSLVKQTNPKAEISTLTYDGLNRLLTKSVAGTQLLKNVYDTCPGGIGRACEVHSYDPGSSVEIRTVKNEYDNRGRASKTIITQAGIPPGSTAPALSETVTYAYDSGGRPLSENHSAVTVYSVPQETINYTYNRPYLYSTGGTSSYVSQARYNKDGQMTRFTSGNGVINSYSYDASNNRLGSLSVTGPNLADTDELLLSYSYNPLGSITKITDDNPLSAPGSAFYLTQNFTYDPLNRLTNTSGAYTASYTYDDIGNILTKTEGPQSVILQYGSAAGGFYHRPQFVSIGGSSGMANTYDVVGNLTRDDLRTYTYDKDNRLAKVTPLGAQYKNTSFYYDASGQRLAKLVTSGPATLYFSPYLELTSQPGNSLGWRKNYYFVGKLVAVRDSGTSAPAPSSTPIRTPTPGPSRTPTPGPTRTPTPSPTPSASVIFSDAFTRANSGIVGNSWIEKENVNALVEVYNNQLYFSKTTDQVNLPFVKHTFTKVTTGQLIWSMDFNWTRTTTENTYRLFMQLGDSATLSDTDQNTGVAISLVWENLNGVQETLASRKGGVDTSITTITGAKNLKITMDFSTHTYFVAVNDTVVKSGIPFSNILGVDTIRLFADALNEAYISGRTFDNITISR
ncbi:MAG: hypothetical protein UX91_C0008G0003 [Candidatus Amesbacteria bacterium GW2011_GWB1_47_19]|nr:MAG: hypothetical protein UX91_C0008G0003 [Candidatus Amesbacteria bacterium GW2011_GWB1_47_19]OGD06149.1 MAG: hypothetical protein A2379_03595 [Candidatus Amesbacteria bacterium RIFOXYB1_FULL_47_13]HBC72255.1 hypothetical protein [Candidatus Amesbacteria bacterium]